MDRISNPAELRLERFVSVVVLFDQTSTSVAESLLDLRRELVGRCPDHELVVVLNGTRSSETVRLRVLVRSLPGTRLLRLDGSSTTDVALLAGVEASIGEYVVTLVGGQDTRSALREAVGLVAAGHEVVQGASVSALSGTAVRRAARRGFLWWSRRISGVGVSSRATYLSVLSRERVEQLLQLRDRPRDLRAMVGQLGERPTLLHYRPGPAGRGPSVSVRDVSRGLHVLTLRSARPIGVGATAGVVGALVCLALVVSPTTSPEALLGRVRLVVALVSGTTLLVATMLGLHILHVARLVRQARGEPGYTLVEELESEDQMTDPARLNTTDRGDR